MGFSLTVGNTKRPPHCGAAVQARMRLWGLSTWSRGMQCGGVAATSERDGVHQVGGDWVEGIIARRRGSVALLRHQWL